MERHAIMADTTITPYRNLSRIARRSVWTVGETALVLRCHACTVYRELYRGAIRGVRIGNEWRIPAYQFDVLTRSLPWESDSERDGDSENGAENPAAQSLCADKCMPSEPSEPSKSLKSLKPPTLADSARSPETTRRAQPPQAPQPSEPVLQVHLLGHPQIYINDMRIEDLERSNRRSQIIQLLALHRGGLSVTQLASLLNLPGHQYEEESLTTNYVRTLVYGTRKQVSNKVGWDGVIESSTRSGAGMHHYKLPDNTVCDLWDFEEKLDEADRLLVMASAAYAQGASWASWATGASGQLGASEPRIARTVIQQAAALREGALQLYRGEFCEGSTNGCLARAARMLEERYIHAALQQGNFWRATALEMEEDLMLRIASEIRVALPSTSTACTAGTTGAPGGATGRVRPYKRVDDRARLDARTIWREALRNYQRVLSVDNYHEEACIQAMGCHAHLCNGRGVGLVFNRYCDVLRADLSQEPEVAVARAYQECKALLSNRASIPC